MMKLFKEYRLFGKPVTRPLNPNPVIKQLCDLLINSPEQWEHEEDAAALAYYVLTNKKVIIKAEHLWYRQGVSNFYINGAEVRQPEDKRALRFAINHYVVNFEENRLANVLHKISERL